VVALNFTPDKQSWGMEEFGDLQLLVGSIGNDIGDDSMLSGYDGRIYLVK